MIIFLIFILLILILIFGLKLKEIDKLVNIHDQIINEIYKKIR